MRGIFVIIDGLADHPNKQLGGKTPLEVAETPNMDFLATRGEMGWMHPVKPYFVPETDEAIVSIFGNDISISARGQLEAKGVESLKLTRGDLAFRINFSTIDSLDKGNILDRRVGRTLTSEEAETLAEAINNKLKLSCKFIFEPTLHHRAVLVLRGGFSENILGNDSTYMQGKQLDVNKIKKCIPLDEEENSLYTANLVNEFLEKAHEILDKHPVNIERKKRGLMPANYLLLRGAGIELPKLKQYKKWISPSYFPLSIGFANASGMNVPILNYPKLKGLDAYANFTEGLDKMCKLIVRTIKRSHKNFDYAYVHLFEPDFAGHDNKPFEKKAMLENIDKVLFKFLRKFAPPNKVKVLVTSNNTTVCHLKSHTADPVPVLIYNDSLLKEKKFSEKEARKGTLGSMIGKELFEKTRFLK